jgi:lysophospholipase L1-like esterase
MKVKLYSIILCLLAFSFIAAKKPVKVYLIGDSTVADYSLEADYQKKRYPLHGWGQDFQPFLVSDSLKLVRNIIKGKQAIVDDRAKGGRSTRTFLEEGRWREVYNALKKDDVVLIQFGHNDGSVEKPERYAAIPAYKEYLRLFVSQTREKKAIPILVTPVSRNYPWTNGKLGSAHGEYPQAMKDVAKELNVKLIDLTALSAESFSRKGEEFVTSKYFMNLPEGVYEAYPKGQKDNTHFQKEGAVEVARLVFEALKKM